EPAHLLTRRLQVIRYIRRGGGLDLDVVEVAARLFGAFAHELQTPLDDGGVGELDDDAVRDSAGGAQGLGAIARHPDGQLVLGPLEPDLDTVVRHLAPSRQVADQAAVRLHLLDGHRLLAEDATCAVAATDAHHHA